MTREELAVMHAAAFHIARAYLNRCDPDPAVVREFRSLSDTFLYASAGS
jgi:hypothetical protein